MRGIRFSIVAAAALALSLGGSALAFHSGGVAECVGCHSMHDPYPGGDKLLIGADHSAACLSCHERAGDTGPSSYHISTPEAELVAGVSPKQRTPGGDFGWLHKTYSWLGRGTPPPTEMEEGHTHGHNIVATVGFDSAGVDTTYGYDADPVNTNAPGGTFVSANLACTSCHDPHGQSRRNLDGSITRPTPGNTDKPISASGSYNNTAVPTADTSVGVYRILAGPGYSVPGASFTGAPDAVAPSTYNQTEATNQVKVAYGRSTATGHNTWSEWCGSCHPGMHYDNGAEYVHPTDEPLNGSTYDNYNAYKKTGDLSGVQASSFTSLVPVIYNTDVYDGATGLKAKAGSASPTYAGPDGSGDRVDCLSCHRAHASGWEFGLRWNPEYEFLTDPSGNYYNWAGGGTGQNGFGSRGRTTAEVEDSYYDRPATVFAKSQRQLCNKCHVKD